MIRKRMAELLAADTIAGVTPLDLGRREVARQFRTLVDAGARLLPQGNAKDDPALLTRPAFIPKHAISLFNVTYYLTDFYHIEDLNFFVGYVAMAGRPMRIYPRIFYKDSSLIWRVASHMIDTDEEQWIGKGDLKAVTEGGEAYLASDESSTNLPYEIQSAFDEVSRRRPTKRLNGALQLILRRAPAGRMQPYADFSQPRRKAAREFPLNRDRPVARIARHGDPTSLVFAAGFAPDFGEGLIEIGRSRSSLYGGAIGKYRVYSENRLVQYQIVHSPHLCWINPPQSLVPEITSYGLRCLHVIADEEIFIPGYEFHIVDNSVAPPTVLYSQIPPGWAGAPSDADPDRADASRWIEALPVIARFRRALPDLERKFRRTKSV